MITSLYVRGVLSSVLSLAFSRPTLAACTFAAGLGACSLYPIPDDISPLSTEQIVRYARCEMRSAILFYMIDHGIVLPPFTDDGIKSQIKTATEKTKAKKPILSPSEKKLLRLANVAVVYAFDFNIKENNKTDAGAGFSLPLTLINLVDVGANATLDLTRQGSRVFGAEDRWDTLITDSPRCDVPWKRPGNIVYPLAGSIGVGRVVSTFIDIDEQGGAKDNFVDTLTFTTSVSGGANASVKLEPVTRQFRLVTASTAYSGSRLDIHKLTISLAFPRPSAPRFDPITGVTRVDGDLNAPFDRPADWRARYNLCVADARAREDSFKQLRLQAPEVYCIAYADEFAPQYGREPERRLVTISPPSRSGDAIPQAVPERQIVPERRVIEVVPRVRPNLRPY